MKKITISINNKFDVFVPDEYDIKKDEEYGYEQAYEYFEEQMINNNEIISNKFYESVDDVYINKEV